MRRIEFATVARWPAQHYNPHDNVVVRVNRKPWELETGAGSSDDVDVFAEGDRIYILSMNHRLGYVGLAEYVLDEKHVEEHQQSGGDEDYSSIGVANEIFIQNEDEVVEILGPKGLDLSPMTIVRKLGEYLQ